MTKQKEDNIKELITHTHIKKKNLGLERWLGS